MLVGDAKIGADLQVATPPVVEVVDVIRDEKAILRTIEDGRIEVFAGEDATCGETVPGTLSMVDACRHVAPEVLALAGGGTYRTVRAPVIILLEANVDDARIALGLVLGARVGDDVDAVDLLGREAAQEGGQRFSAQR